MTPKELYDILTAASPHAWGSEWDGHGEVTLDGEIDLTVMAEKINEHFARTNESA